MSDDKYMNPTVHPENLLFSFLGYQANRNILFQPPIPSSLLYHYADIAAFWEIIDDEILRAGNIRFSNDTQELKIGTDFVNGYTAARVDHDVTKLSDIFVTCFSARGDQRSQWSEYCRGTLGISIGFDFSGNLPFERREVSKWPDIYGRNARYFFGYNCFAIVPDPEKKSEQPPVHYAIAPYKVVYVDTKDKKEISSRPAANDKTKNLSVYTSDEIKEDIEKSHEFPFHMNLLIPYIKHPAFVEEEEYRLVFDMASYKDSLEKFEDYLWYTDKYYKHIPGLKIKSELPRPIDFSKNGYLKFRCGNGCPIALSCKIETIPAVIDNFLQDHNIVFDKQLDVTIPQCDKQRDIFKEVESHLKYHFKKHLKERANLVSPKIWCEGHLPIRKIIVEQGQDTELIVESIQSYLKTRYWLNYVDVRQSQIPYRKR
jgi:hypothetical protein